MTLILERFGVGVQDAFLLTNACVDVQCSTPKKPGSERLRGLRTAPYSSTTLFSSLMGFEKLLSLANGAPENGALP